MFETIEDSDVIIVTSFIRGHLFNTDTSLCPFGVRIRVVCYTAVFSVVTQRSWLSTSLGSMKEMYRVSQKFIPLISCTKCIFT